MKVFREIYDFITGGSIAAPAGLAVAIVAARFGSALSASAQAGLFAGILLLTFVASTLERAK